MSAYRRQRRSKVSESAKVVLRGIVARRARFTKTSELRRLLPNFSVGVISMLRSADESLSWERLLLAAEVLNVPVEIRVDERIAA